jgi:3D (Asp-Asp-Asp) domain-containing protein
MKHSNKPAKDKFSLIFLGFLFLLMGVLELNAQAIRANKVEEDDIFNREIIAMIGNDSILAISSPSEPEPKVAKTINVLMTAYSSTVWQTDSTPFITASNTYVRDGIVANNGLPFGTKVRFPELYGDKVFVVEDRMNAKKGNYHVDIWFPSYSEAKVFGVKNTYMEVLEG